MLTNMAKCNKRKEKGELKLRSSNSKSSDNNSNNNNYKNKNANIFGFLMAAMLLSFTALFPIVSLADSTRTPEYITADGKSLDKLFKLDGDDIGHPFEWLPNHNTFPAIEKSDYKDQVWMNVPNLQLLLVGKVDGLIANGYTESGVDIDDKSKDTMYETDFENGQSGMSKFGFNIPSPTYKGEYPVISYNFSSVLPKGVWGTIKSAVRGFFGGSYIEAPSSAEDFASLRYENVTDYIEDYSHIVWIKEHWEDTCDWIEEQDHYGQVLLPKKICGNNHGTVDGQDYTYETCIVNNNLQKIEGTPEEFNRKLKTTFGQYYGPIFDCMVGCERNHKESVITNFTLRVMPYDTASIDHNLKNIDTELVRDPRCDIGVYFQSLHMKDNYAIYHSISEKLLNFFGNLAKFSRYLNNLTNFNVLEDLGVHLDILWQTPIMKPLVILFMIFVVIITCKYGISVAKGSMGVREGILKTGAGLLLSIVLFAIAIRPVTAYDAFKNIVGIGDSLASSVVEASYASEYMTDSVEDQEKYDMAYWIPYFELWSYYNTAHSLTENDIDTGNASNEPEQDEINLPTIGGKENKHWNVMLASSFCDGYVIKPDAYRVVDHFLAPRVDYDWDDKEISSTANENYTNDIQSTIGANWMIVVDIFLLQIIKVLFFFNMCFEFMFLFLFIIFKYRDYGVKDTLKGFLASIAEYWAASFIIPIASVFTFVCGSKFLPCAIVTIFLIGYQYFFFKLIIRGSAWMQPKLLRLIMNRGRRI